MGPFTYSIDEASVGLLELSGELTVAHVGELHRALCAVDGRLAALEVRCASLTRLDAAAVQLLFAAAGAAGQPRVVAPPEAWTSAFVRYGVCDPFLPLA